MQRFTIFFVHFLEYFTFVHLWENLTVFWRFALPHSTRSFHFSSSPQFYIFDILHTFDKFFTHNLSTVLTLHLSSPARTPSNAPVFLLFSILTTPLPPCDLQHITTSPHPTPSAVHTTQTPPPHSTRNFARLHHHSSLPLALPKPPPKKKLTTLSSSILFNRFCLIVKLNVGGYNCYNQKAHQVLSFVIGNVFFADLEGLQRFKVFRTTILKIILFVFCMILALFYVFFVKMTEEKSRPRI